MTAVTEAIPISQDEPEPRALGMMGLARVLLGYLRPYRAQALLIVLALLVELAFYTLFALSFKILIDEAILPRDGALLARVAGLLVAGFVVTMLATVGRLYLTAAIGADMLNAMRLRMFEKLQELSLGFFARTPTGDLLSRFSNDLAAVEGAVMRGIPTALYSGLQLAVTVVLLFVLDWRLALITLLALPLTFLGPKLLGSRATRAGYGRRQDEAGLLSLVQEQIAAQPVVRAFGLQPAAVGQLRRAQAALADSTTAAVFLAQLSGRSTGIGVTFVQLLVVTGGSVLALNGLLTVGSLVAFVSLLLTLGRAMVDLSLAIPDWLQAIGGMQRIEDLLAVPAQVLDAHDAQTLPGVSREIRFDDVVFGYLAHEPSLQNVRFAVPAGQSVVFVGRSGSGKSTILSLLARFYDPDQGAVSIDGQDLRQVSQESLRRHFGVVFQDSFLFNTTIRENIRLARPAATDEEVVQAARAAEMHDTIMSQPKGYDTPVGERGGNLSGGQRQRIALARAILRDPPVLVLDEATSALDPETEAAINATIGRLAAGRTLISVTHRLSTIARADRIFVLDAGRIVEEGTHDELLAAGGRYSQLWQQQSGFTIGPGGRGAIEATRLRSIPLFAHIDDAHLARIADRFAPERYLEERVVFHEGDPGDRFYIIARGSVEVLKHGPDGEPHRVSILQDGEIFGERALLGDVPRSATIRTLTPSIFLTLAREQFLDLLDEAPQLRAAIEQVAARRRQEDAAY